MKADRPGETLRKSEKAQLSELIRRAYRETRNNSGNVLNLDAFAQKYLKVAIPELYGQMRQYIGDGIYSRFFDSTTALDDVDIFCFDLEGLSEHPDLETVLTLVITRLTYDMCIRNRGIRKMIVIDEAWAQLSGGGLSATVEGIWRTIRKHGGFIYCISQSYGDVLKSKIGDALTTSTSHYYFCGASHSYDVIRTLKATGSNTHTISEYDFECIQGLKFNPPHYADYFLMTPNYKGTLRLRPSVYDYWFSTTNARDKAKLDKVKHRLGVPYVTREVLEEVSRGNA
jgi:conjugal transfer ATP-binding protein TraC